MKLFRLLFILSAILLFSCNDQSVTNVQSISIIPQPVQLETSEGYFVLDKNTKISAPDIFDNAYRHLLQHLQNGAAFGAMSATSSDAYIRMELDEEIVSEGYKLKVDETGVLIEASDASGAFYGVQSLKQLLPVELERTNSIGIGNIGVPYVNIDDHPLFSYRGMHLDVGRHFYPKEFVKEYIANLARLKMNYFHWHLTEDQGWRIEILQYPNLTRHGAFRDETLVGHYNDSPQEFDGNRYGGFYTQEDIKEIVAYAQSLQVTIIPEIEMPGHAQAAISAYPELGCTGKQVAVATKWGVFEEVYCPTPETFTFLKNVLTEVMHLFPGEYIHIGGDEAPKEHWKSCIHCQKLIEDLGLKSEEGLQSYFIKEIESFVNSKGKKIIGWDEILEGGLAPNATVMSWRGTEGAVAAAKDGHDVILTPTSHAYFDYYQADHDDEPLAIGGFLPLKKVFSFNPIPKELTEKEAIRVLGAQGNIWTEYMPTEDQVEYMAFPRILAMSEVVWGGAQENVESTYPKFLAKVEHLLPRLEMLDINYANHLYDLTGSIVKENGSVFYKLTTTLASKEIRYSLQNDEAHRIYKEPISIQANTTITAAVYDGDTKLGRSFTQKLILHKGVSGRVTINKDPHPAYSAGGKEALLNGIMGSDSRYGDKEWLGFWGEDLQLTIEFDEMVEINKLSTRFYDAPGQWIYTPEIMASSITLADGSLVGTRASKVANKTNNIVSMQIEFSEKQPIWTKKIELRVPNYGTIPEGAQGSGNKSWTFIDEIIIE